MARLTAFSFYQDELAFPRIASIETAFTFTEPFQYNGIRYSNQFELAALSGSGALMVLAIGSNTGLSADDANQSAIGTGQGLYLYASSGGNRTPLFAIENTSFDVAGLLQAVKSLPDDFSGAFILEELLSGNDTVTFSNAGGIAHGYGGNDTMRGGTAADVLYGDGGRDSLSGGIGNDLLDGGAGVDTLVGGAGDDLFFFTTNDTIVERAGGGKDTMRSNVSFTLAKHIEYGRLDDGPNALTLTGNAASNSLSGNTTKNTLNGMDGNDVLFGNGGRDTLKGGNGRDTLKGGNGRDTLVGEAGADALYGGAGRDVFLFSAQDGKGSNRDTIHDLAAGDIIDIRFLGATELSARAGANTAWLTRQADGTLISVDYSGDAVAEVEVFVRGSYRLGASDFDFA